jgi:GNAT superfamily N-acetyltransferase
MRNDIPEIKHLCFLNRKNIEKFVRCNANAYASYSLMDYLAGGTDRKFVYWLWHANMHSLAKGAIAFADSDEVKGIMVWMPPRTGVVNDLKFLWHGGLRFLPKLWRLIRTENYSTMLKNKYTDEDTWYLFDFAVDPTYQHQNVASKLMLPILQYMDRIHASCYLETYEEHTIAMYERYGFKLVFAGDVPKSNLKQYCMRRCGKDECAK